MGKVRGAPECRSTEFQAKTFQLTVKIRTSRYKTIQCFIATLPTYIILKEGNRTIRKYTIFSVAEGALFVQQIRFGVKARMIIRLIVFTVLCK